MELAAVRHQQGPGGPVQDPVQQPQGVDGYTQGGQSDHPEGGQIENREEQVGCGERESQ